MPLILLFIQYSFNAQHVSAVNTTIVLTAETCWALNEYWINNKISGIKLVFSLLNYKDDARSHKNKIHIGSTADKIWNILTLDYV